MFRPRLLLLSSLILAAGCRASLTPLAGSLAAGGRSAAELRNGADELFAALASRYGTVERAPKFAAARQKIGQYALIPSRVFDDTAVWTVRPTSVVHILLAEGAATGTSYRFRPVPVLPELDHLGDARHRIVLTKLGESEYRWDTSVDYAVGSLGARPAAALVGAFLASADARRPRDLALDYRATMPRTAAALGLLFSVDSIHSTPLRDGSSVVALAVSMHTERLRQRWPELARYLQRYVSTGKWKLALRDPAGAWVTGEAGNDRMLLRFRTANGRLAPISGAWRAMPDTLLMDLDLSAKVGPFTVGFDGLHSQVARINTAHEASWEVISRQEPEWRLPLFAERLIRTPLHRPFEGEGAHFRIGFRDEGNQTLLARHVSLAVQESAILRFIGRLGATAFGDISDTVEQQEAQFLRSVFSAMRADLAAANVAGSD